MTPLGVNDAPMAELRATRRPHKGLEAGTRAFPRTREEVTAPFGDRDIFAPSVTDISAWRNPACQPCRTIGYGDIARKNT